MDPSANGHLESLLFMSRHKLCFLGSASVYSDGDAGEQRRSKVARQPPPQPRVPHEKQSSGGAARFPAKAGNESRDVLVEPLTCTSLVLFPLAEGTRGSGQPQRQNQWEHSGLLVALQATAKPRPPWGSCSHSSCLRECFPEFVHNANEVAGLSPCALLGSVRFCSVLLTRFLSIAATIIT